MLISLIVPCFNEEESLPILHKELCAVTETMQGYAFEFCSLMMVQRIRRCMC